MSNNQSAKSIIEEMSLDISAICGLVNIFFTLEDELWERALNYSDKEAERATIMALANRLRFFENESTIIDGFAPDDYVRLVSICMLNLQNWVFWGVYHIHAAKLTKRILKGLDDDLDKNKITREVYDVNHRNFVMLFALLDKLALAIGYTMREVAYEPYQIKDFDSPADKAWLERRNADKALVNFGLLFKTKQAFYNITNDATTFVFEIGFEFYKVQRCSICSCDYEGFGNNAQPINDGRCCDRCNQRVIVARIRKAEAESRGNTYVVRQANEPQPKGEIVSVSRIPTAAELEAVEKAQQELLQIWDKKDSSSDSKKPKKSKKEQEKDRVRQANKERDAKKREREAFYKRCGMIYKK